MTYNYSKTFFSKKRAESFQAELKAQGINADIWTGADYLNHGGTLYYGTSTDPQIEAPPGWAALFF